MENLKKSALIFGIMAVALALVFSATMSVRADSDDNDLEDLFEGKGAFKFDKFPPGLDKKRDLPKGPSFTVNPQGRVLISAGEVTEANWPNLKVKVWGLSLSVHVMPNAVIHGAAAPVVNTSTSTATTTPPTTTGGVSVGDKVDILGEMESSTGLIHALHFKNRSQTDHTINALQQRIQELLKEIEKIRQSLKDIRKGL